MSFTRNILIFTFFLFTPNLFAATFESAPQATQFIELYTSEGCSSCAVADEWMGELSKEKKKLWKDFVAVSFHVDYWDHLGWKDRFANPLFAKRQKSYSMHWGQTSIYTPSIVLNGEEWVEWFTTHDFPKRGKEKIGVLKVETEDFKTVHVQFEPVSTAQDIYQVHAALLGFDIDSKVDAGENAGRTINQDFVVLAYGSKTLEKTEGKFDGTVELGVRSEVKAPRYAVAAWVSTINELTTIQATGGFIDSIEVDGGKEK